MKHLMKQETIAKYEKIAGRKPPIVMGIQDDMQATIQLIIMESYLEGYNVGKKKYKRFKQKFLNERAIKEKLQRDNEVFQDKQIAAANR